MMTDAETRRIAEAAAEAAVEKVLLRLGLDPESDDFPDWRRDFAYLRRLRVGSELLKTTGLRTIMSVITTAIVGGLLAALYRYFPHP